MLTATISLSLVLAFSHMKPQSVYKGRTLDSWFYGYRTNFFLEATRRAAQEALNGAGTNAFPFLLSQLKASGNGARYFKLYGASPGWVRSRLPVPLSGDDIRAIALQHLEKLNSLSRQQVQAVADCVADFENPRLRMMGFNVTRRSRLSGPAFPDLRKKFLDDPHAAIRLEAAIDLAESASAPESDHRDPGLFLILIAGLENKEMRESYLDISGYRYNQQPPGGSGPFPLCSLSSLRLVRRLVGFCSPSLGVSDFGLLSAFGLRISDFPAALQKSAVNAIS